MMRRRVLANHTKIIHTCDLYNLFPPIYSFLHAQSRFYKPQASSKSSQHSLYFASEMEGTHSSSMKQEPSSTGNLAFSRQPPSPSRAETSQISKNSQTWGQESGNLTSSSGRERLKRHIEEVSGKVMIPDSWGQENLLTDWIDYSSFDKLLAPKGITSAREALIAEGRRACTSPHQRLRVESSC